MSERFQRWLCFLCVIFAIAGGDSLTWAQNREEAPAAREDVDRQQTAQEQPGQMGRASPEMQEMARAMKSMAETCQMMMEKEMRSQPYRMAALIIVGALLAVALVLFIILEVQWIRYWGLRIKVERTKVT